MEEKKSTQVSSDTVTMSKADFDSLQASIASLKGLGDLVKSQSEEIISFVCLPVILKIGLLGARNL